jgi:hypothetical protein
MPEEILPHPIDRLDRTIVLPIIPPILPAHSILYSGKRSGTGLVETRVAGNFV